MKKILGLDLGTNSIGWAVVRRENDNGNIAKSGDRIIPMDAATLGDFANGNTKSQTKERTAKRTARRMRERFLLRRERLHRLLHLLGFLPEHYDKAIGWDIEHDSKHYGTFLNDEEPKIAWKKNQYNKYEFIFMSSFLEMLDDFKKQHPTFVSDKKKIPYDWTLYYLRQKALSQRISKEELAWIILNFNQKRGYNQQRDEILEISDEKEELTVGQRIYSAILSNPSEKIRGGLFNKIERRFYEKELRLILKKQEAFHPELRNRKLYEQCIKDLYKSNIAHRNSIAHNDFTYLILEDVLFYQRPLKSKKSLIDDCPYESYEVIKKDTGEICTYPLKCIARSNPYFQEYRVWKFMSDLRIIANSQEIDGHIQSDVDVTDTFIPDNQSWSDLFLWLNNKGYVGQSELLTHLGIKKKEQSNYRWNYVTDKKYPMNATRHAILSKMQAGETLKHDTEQKLWHLLYSTKSKAEIDKSLSSSDKPHSIHNLLVNEGFSDDTISKIKTTKLPDEGYGAYSEKAIKKLLPLMRCGKLWSEENIHPQTMQHIRQYQQGMEMANFSENVRLRILAMTDLHSFQRLPEWLACYIVYGRHSEAKNNAKWTSPGDIDRYLRSFRQHSLRNPIVESVVMETLRVVRDIWKRYGNIDEIHIELGRNLKNPSDKRAKITQRIQKNENTNLRIKALLAEMAAEEFEVKNVRPYSPYQQELLRIYEEDVLAHHKPDDEIRSIMRSLSNPTKQPTRAQVLRYKCWLDKKYYSPYTGEKIPLSDLFTSAYEIEHIIPQSRYFDDSFSNKVICELKVNQLKDNKLGYEFIKQHHGQILIIPVKIKKGDTEEVVSEKMVRILEVEQYEQHVKDYFAQNKQKKLLMDDIPAKFTQRQLNDSRYISKFVMGILSNVVRAVDKDGNPEREAISKNVIACNGAVTARLKRDWGLSDVWNAIVLPRFQRLNELTGRDCFTTLNSHGKLIPAMPLEWQKGFDIKRIDHRHHALDAIVIACTTREHVNLLNNEFALPKDQKQKQELLCELGCCQEVVINGEKKTVYKFFIPWTSFKEDTLASLQEIIVSFKQNLRVLTQATNLYTKYDNGEKKPIPQKSPDHYAIRKPLHQDTVYGHVNLQRITTVSLKKALKKDVNRIVDKRLKKKIKELRSLHYNEKQLLAYFKEHSNEWEGYDLNKVSIFYFTDETKEIMAATRHGNDLVSVFNGKSEEKDGKTKKKNGKIEKGYVEKAIEDITDTGIQRILTNYLNANLENIEYAFSAEGLEEMNEHIATYNNGKQHKPIYKVRMSEAMGKKFKVGFKGSNSKKYVKADTNLFFAIYITDDKQRKYRTIPLEEVIERMKQKLHPVKETDTNGNKLLFHISPNDLVYLPTSDELINENIDFENLCKDRIYKFIDGSGTTANFVPNTISNVIYHLKKDEAEKFCKMEVIQDELGKGSPQSKNQKALTGEMIKETCIPLTVDRLGIIKKK